MRWVLYIGVPGKRLPDGRPGGWWRERGEAFTEAPPQEPGKDPEPPPAPLDALRALAARSGCGCARALAIDGSAEALVHRRGWAVARPAVLERRPGSEAPPPEKEPDGAI